MFSTLLKGSSKSLISGFALGAAVLFTSFNASAAAATDNSLDNFKYCEGGTKIDQETARKLIQNHGAVVIDVRSPEEYAKGHLKDAYLISFTLDQLAKQNLAEHELLKGTSIIQSLNAVSYYKVGQDDFTPSNDA